MEMVQGFGYAIGPALGAGLFAVSQSTTDILWGGPISQ